MSRAGDAYARREVEVAPVVLIEQVHTLATAATTPVACLRILDNSAMRGPSLVDC